MTTTPTNLYLAHFRGRCIEVVASSSFAAQEYAAVRFKARRSYDVTVQLVAKDNVPVPLDTSAL